jgi:anti-sigma factor RsiW
VNCREFVRFLADYLSGDLEPRRLAVFEAHVERCPPCLNYLDAYRRTMSLVRASAFGAEEPLPTDVPEELILAIVASVR